MRIPGSRRTWLAAVLVAAGGAVAAFVIARSVLVPAMIVRALQARTGGRVEIGSYWLNGCSAGVTGLKLHDGDSAAAPVWADVPSVSTDLSLGGLVRGRFAPGRVNLKGPKVTLRFGEKGDLKTRLRFASGGSSGSGPLPVVVADSATIRIEQEGRPAMVVGGVTARLGPDGDKVSVALRTNDPDWGPVEALGRFAGDFGSGRLELKSTRGLSVTPEKVRAIPFVPPEVWANVALTGEVDIRLTVGIDKSAPRPLNVTTEIGLRRTTVRSDTLGLTAGRATGRVVVDGAVVRLERVSGEAIDGRVSATGTLDFSGAPKFDLGLDLEKVDVTKAPKSWQLDEAGVTGRLTGKVRLLALLGPEGMDLSGTSGDAVVEGGTVQGIPFKTLRLVMQASGTDLQYGTAGAKSSWIRPWTAPGLAPLVLTAVQAPVAGDAEEKKPAPRKPVFQLPKSLTTRIELEDVELATLIARAELLLGLPFPIPVTGRLSIKADATIPLGRLKSVKDYAFHGDLTLKRASAYKVDLGRVEARVDLADGRLELTDLRGHLSDRPDGGPDNPPQDVGEIPKSGPLPRGGFRGKLSAQLSPPGRLAAEFEGRVLPLGELAAPVLPRPTPLSGFATLRVDASVDLNAARDPAAWVASGWARSREIRYQDAALDAVSVTFDLKQGRLNVPELTALLRERPLAARFGLDLKPPYAFGGTVDVNGWDVAPVLAWLPDVPKPAPVAGIVTAHAGAKGTIRPFNLRTEGAGRFDRVKAGPVPLGDVPFSWVTKDDAVEVTVSDARPFGGRLSAEANVPLTAGRPVTGELSVRQIDTAAVAAAVPGGKFKLTGRASGELAFSAPSDASALRADLRLSAPGLTVQGLPAEHLNASLHARKGSVHYEVTADSLGGKVVFQGEVPLVPSSTAGDADGELRAVGFLLERVLPALGFSGAATRIRGEGAIDANLRAVLAGKDAGLYAHGVTEVRNLRMGNVMSFGRVRGVVALTPSSWRVDPIHGDLLGGVLTGFLWGTTPAADPAHERDGISGGRVGFEVRIDRASLRSALAMVPSATLPFAVQGFGTLRAAGTLGQTLRASGELHVGRARVAGITLTDLRLPAEVTTTNGHDSGMVQVRKWSAKLAGGNLHGDARFHFGVDRSFHTDLVLAAVDLEPIARIESEARRPASGKISGKISLHGSDPTHPESYRGKIVLDLNDASVVALPVFREVNRFLGAAGGGMFEDGDLNATIANRQIQVEMLTLEGRLAQVHATGSVGFDGQLNLEVLANTNQIISQTGQTLVSAIPGLNNVVGRNAESSARVAGFLSNKLLKFRVTGTVRSPSVALDPGVGVGDGAVGFFSSIFKLPTGR